MNRMPLPPFLTNRKFSLAMPISNLKSSSRVTQVVREKMKETTILITPKWLLDGWPTLNFAELKGSGKDTIIECLSRYGAGRTKASDELVVTFQKGNGHWLICSCNGKGEHPPTLFFRKNHLVRHHQSSEHHVDCAFYRSISEQNASLRSYAKPSRKKLALLGKFQDGNRPPREVATRKEGKWRRRSTLARLLCTLLTRAEIQNTSSSSPRPNLEKQLEKIERQARGFYLDDRVRLSQALCTNPAEIEAFKARVASNELPWDLSSRRQGVFLFHVDKVEDRKLFPVGGGAPIEVLNRIAVYGEMTPDDDEAEEGTVNTRSPYLCIGIVGQQVKDGPVETLSCYLHPSYSDDDMMLVDSILERKTFDQIVSTALTLRSDKVDVALTVEKPLFDVSPETVADEEDEGADDKGSRPVLIPDFIVRVTGKARKNNTIVIETLGFESKSYRDRKEVLVPMMCEALGGAAYVDYDFFDESEDERSRHRSFRGRLRYKISGWFEVKADRDSGSVA
ncbi:hypothetical protein [Agrobacterium pusense]|uniref:hypothetical protein n=1 Tax=Agrobacterium pusense TaxID=648995 RepID=UPI001AE86BE9|nr:hypothetical protein [Agrobacterium pusense]MBP2611442.1 hypothetical protein [Agrobacterium pusense]